MINISNLAPEFFTGDEGDQFIDDIISSEFYADVLAATKPIDIMEATSKLLAYQKIMYQRTNGGLVSWH